MRGVIRRLGVATLLLVVLAACTKDSNVTVVAATGPVDGLEVIVDYSPTVSDVGALLYLQAHPGVDVVAVTLPTTGEAGCELGYRVTAGLLALMERPEIPVACGASVPESAERWPDEFLVGQEALAAGLPEPAAEQFAGDAAELMAGVLTDSDDGVTILAVAPLTNLAELLDRHLKSVDAVERIVIMGGALDVSGNVPSKDGEWNFFVDAAAAGRVMRSSIPKTLVPLDATNDVPVPPDYQDMIGRAGTSPALEYLAGLAETFPFITEGGFYFWDELAALISANALEVEVTDVRVAVAGEGRTVRDDDGTKTTVIVGVPTPEGLHREFLDRLALANP